MIIKLPPAYDISHWKEVIDFKLVSPKPALFITKATEDVATIDRKFVRFFSGMMEIGCIRGAFHFLRKAYNPYKQADHFINTISKMDILPTDLLILDVEELGTKAASMWAWFQQVRQAFPDNRLLLYSSTQYLNPIYMTIGEKEYFKKIPIWAAGYPYYPDKFDCIPPGYIPDQTKYGKPVLWQYTSHGRVDGITTELYKPTDVDINWIEPEFYETLGSNAMETTMATFTGTCKSADSKVWSSIGGQQIGSVRNGDNVKGDQETTDHVYIHLTEPIVGWTKKMWFTITYDTTPPPPPPDPEPTITITHTIDIFNDGKISVDNGTPI